MNYVRLLTLAVADFPAAIGIELMNEPPTVDSAALYQLFHECHDAVRAISPDMAVGVMDFVSCHNILPSGLHSSQDASDIVLLTGPGSQLQG